MPAKQPRIPTLLLVGSCALFPTRSVFRQAHTQASDQAAQDAVPEGLSKGDWAGIRAAYEAGRHAAYSVEGGYQARNPGQGWRTHFDGRGFLTQPDTGDWTWGLELERYGFAGSEKDVTSPVHVSAQGGCVAYAWNATLEEWYVNDTRGLEHGYTVHRRPERDEQHAESPLTFTLAVRGDLRADVAADGRGVRFMDESGAVVLTYEGLLVHDADGREFEASFEALVDGGDRLLLSVEEHGARYPLVIDPIAQQAYLKASNTGEAWDYFGESVAVSGDTVVVGAHGEDSSATGVNGDQGNNSATDAGAAYVFVRTGPTWSQEAYLKASNTDGGDFFGSGVAVSGDTVVIGAPGEDSNITGVNGSQSDNSAERAGAVYVFVRNGTSWSQEAYLKASNTDVGDQFGGCVAVSGDVVVAGAVWEDSSATGVDGDQGNNSAADAGAAYVFVRSGTSWSQEAYLKASNGDVDDWFGLDVAVSGDTVVAGAMFEDSSATGVNGNQQDNSAWYAGAAYVFVRSGTSWSQQAYLKASNTDTADLFGNAVAVSGDTVVIGAALESSSATGVNGNQKDNSAWSAGAAYVFVRSGASWSQQAYLKASNTNADDGFGGSVAVSGDTVVVGASAEDGGATGVNGNQSDNSATNAGAAYVFVRIGTSWSQEAYVKASNTDAFDFFGYSVVVSGDTVVAGARSEDSNATGVNGNQGDDSVMDAGAAYVFELGGEDIGMNYCGPANLNSSGQSAVISALGSAVAAQNQLTLTASQLPSGKFGYFLNSDVQGFTPLPPGSSGNLCLAGGIGRHAKQVANSGAAGEIVITVDLIALPRPNGTHSVVAGETWNFQCWFRDNVGGPTSNFTDGIEIVFN